MRSRDRTSGRLLALAERVTTNYDKRACGRKGCIDLEVTEQRERTDLCIQVYISRGTRRVVYDVTNALSTIYKMNRSATEVGLGRRESITYPKGECSGLLPPSSGVRAGRLAL